MKTRALFWIFSTLLLIVLAALTYFVILHSSRMMFFIVEGIVLLTVIFLFIFYSRIIKPLYVIGSGMDLLREQDFSSRLSIVGQTEADRIVDIFNKMMEQLKNERLQIREQNHFLDLLINASPLGVVILSLDKEIESVNSSMCTILGVDESLLKGKRLKDIDSYIANELAEMAIRQSKTIRLNDANIYKCTHSSFVDHGFQRSFFLIEMLTAEVAAAERKAYEKVIRMIAHEVNNTTAGMISTLDTILSSVDTENDVDTRDVLRIAIERCYGMSSFISAYADVVRIPEPVISLVELNRLVVSSKRFMENICRDRDIEIITDLNTPLSVNIDSSLFEQVLVNIIKNAVESIERSGKIYIRILSDQLCLEIADTGKGIDKDAEAKLFSPFFSTKPNGQGLGLIFIREVLLKHGFTFSLHTYSDGLTRFRIFFK